MSKFYAKFSRFLYIFIPKTPVSDEIDAGFNLFVIELPYKMHSLSRLVFGLGLTFRRA